MCREAGLDPLNSVFSAPREGTLRPVRSTRMRALPPFERCPSAVRPFGGLLGRRAPARVQEVSKAGVATCDGRSVNRYRVRASRPGNGMRIRCERNGFHSA